MVRCAPPRQDAGTDVGPLINADAAESVGQLVTDAVEGAEVLCGGSAPTAPHFYSPTVLLTPPMHGSTEEIGPVAPITTFTSDAEAIAWLTPPSTAWRPTSTP
jgi:succinate-semialdehyde dehydrogenase/glutarate-semialdehyde dehydrogenase